MARNSSMTVLLISYRLLSGKLIPPEKPLEKSIDMNYTLAIKITLLISGKCPYISGTSATIFREK
jgi:hypothetical protein